LLAEVARVAPVGSVVLIQDETGTGKEVIAHAIHDASARRNNRFVVRLGLPRTTLIKTMRRLGISRGGMRTRLRQPTRGQAHVIGEFSSCPADDLSDLQLAETSQLKFLLARTLGTLLEKGRTQCRPDTLY
jgi:KaiC/GvpD/RAD55 family RecA-like ATPase